MFGIKEKFPNHYEKILIHNINFHNITWGQKLYNYINNINTQPICGKDGCYDNVRFYKFSRGYSTYCSNACKCSDNALKEKIKKTFLNKYGVDNPLKSEEVQNKRKKMFLDKYGVEHQSQLESVKNKRKQTNLERYGVITNLLHVDVINKIKQTNLKKFGVEHNSQCDEIKEKKKKTNLKKFGVEHNFQSESTKEKSRITTRIKYGFEFSSQSKIIRDKQQQIKRDKKIIEIVNQLNINLNEIEYVDGEYVISNYCNIHKTFKISSNLLHQRWFKYDKNICTKCHPIGKHYSIKECEVKNFIENELKLKTE
jgi:flagellar hook protein FlgE